ncbi:hypothetical protein PILCRDRAFT_13796 [Piloderma croceum F 1598]|uniref:MYND-type domain-containing protein n=1 Tax=Piloderma croceum (strain F 1598) TaxID=765440 RepID=A0A0C3BD91_PILCF|nr:hypothetical protein PILCRDRAFT_13796 [Piloderma croceum F 1598]
MESKLPEATDNLNDSGLSIWARKLNLTSFRADPWGWNKEWEIALRTLSFSKDVYPVMGSFITRLDPTKLSGHLDSELQRVSNLQNVIGKVCDVMEKGHLATAWLVLPTGGRKRHLLKGMDDACKHASLQQDSRALCPDITISAMLKQRGRVFVDFLDAYLKGKKDAGEHTPYLLPTEGWETPVESIPQSGASAESIVALLACYRNEFISQFMFYALKSILHDLTCGSARMDPVTHFMEMEVSLQPRIKTLPSMRDKPVIRCENCTKRPEEIGRNVKFMLCSVCTSKLDFMVHYCSRACQKDDWREHKKHCGKSKVSKKLPGTVNDPFWIFPEMSDHLRHIPMSAAEKQVTSIGFGNPNTAPAYSPALQRQVSLITADKYADYFLFDEDDCPVRFVLHDTSTKMVFRIVRSGVLSSNEEQWIGFIAECLIKMMGQKPGLSRERILEQLGREYGGDIAEEVAKVERNQRMRALAVSNGRAGNTMLEVLSENMLLLGAVIRSTGQRSV